MDVLKDLLEKQKAEASADTTSTETKANDVETGATIETPTNLPDAAPVVETSTVEGDNTQGTADSDDEITLEINRFKELVSFDGELDDFSVDSIAKVLNAKLEVEREAINSLTADEDVKALLDWKQKGYDLESFLTAPKVFNKESYSIDTDGDAIITHVYKNLKGLNDDDVSAMLDVLNLDPAKKQAKFEEFTSLLETKSKEEYDAFIANQNEIIDNKKAELRQTQAVINSGNLKYLVINDATEKASFVKYLESPEVGKKWKNLTPEQAATIEYLIYKDFNIDNFIKPSAAASTEQKRKPIQIVNVTTANNKTVSNQRALLDKILNSNK